MLLLTEMRYQLLRRKNRTVLMLCIAAALISTMAFYLGSIQTGERALQDLCKAVPVEIMISNNSGRSRTGIEIRKRNLDGLLALGVRDAAYTAKAYLMNGTGAPEETNTSVLAVNALSAASGIQESGVTLADGAELSALQRREAVCLVSRSYAQRFSLQIGDALTAETYINRFGKMGILAGMSSVGTQTLRVIGIYDGDAGSFAYDAVVPVGWLEDAAAAVDKRLSYDSFEGCVADPLRLNDFKAGLRQSGFGISDANVVVEKWIGDAAALNDQAFIENAERLQQNRRMLSWFLVPFFALVLFLITLVTFLVLRGSRRDMAIACSVGRSRGGIWLSYFCGTLSADVLGGVIALPVVFAVTGLSWLTLLTVFIVFLLCAALGTGAALLLILRFDALRLLTRTD